MRSIIIWMAIGAILGVSLGGFIQKSKVRYDADLIKYDALQPTPTPVPVATPQAEVNSNESLKVPVVDYQGYPVEFLLQQQYYAYNPSELNDNNCAFSAYNKFYHVNGSDSEKINGYRRMYLFKLISLKNFEILHNPFYGIKVIYCPYSGGRAAWAYCIWSLNRKAPIPFEKPSQAVSILKRQRGKE